MKQTKKIIAALAAATMVASCAGVVASADEAVNAVNVSYSTVAETFTAADGTVVPAGATAVTLSIENNTGFSASDITLNATADLLAVDGMVAATNGSAYGDAIVSAPALILPRPEFTLPSCSGGHPFEDAGDRITIGMAHKKRAEVLLQPFFDMTRDLVSQRLGSGVGDL